MRYYVNPDRHAAELTYLSRRHPVVVAEDGSITYPDGQGGMLIADAAQVQAWVDAGDLVPEESA